MKSTPDLLLYLRYAKARRHPWRRIQRQKSSTVARSRLPSEPGIGSGKELIFTSYPPHEIERSTKITMEAILSSFLCNCYVCRVESVRGHVILKGQVSNKCHMTFFFFSKHWFFMLLEIKSLCWQQDKDL